MIQFISMLWLVGLLAANGGFAASSTPRARHHILRTQAVGGQVHKTRHAHRKRVKHQAAQETNKEQGAPANTTAPSNK